MLCKKYPGRAMPHTANVPAASNFFSPVWTGVGMGTIIRPILVMVHAGEN